MKPSQEAFAAMICIFENYQFNIWYANNLQGLNDSFVPFEKLVSIKLPDLHKHLKEKFWLEMGIEHYSSLFLPNWLLELFYSALPFDLLLRSVYLQQRRQQQ
eukprot:TRINITY_DN7330_c0_g3_i1.p1 TRINITY_DN7330_c0_g3~~TRINITY_DN7330_c0_g3_i1.p1  ORF type:complete len:117 (-),score=32.33 TRINITY_DN7330_c0_g3_i1:319-624(-)